MGQRPPPGRLDLTDTDLTPAMSTTSGFHLEVRISTGNVGGYVERVTVFTGGITLPETSGSLYGPLRLTADDRLRTVARSRLPPWNTPAGTPRPRSSAHCRRQPRVGGL